MSFFTGARQSQNSSAVLPRYTGLQLSTAVASLPIPICYGLTKIATNVLYYNNFTAVPEFSAQQSSGKGGIFGGGGGGLTITGWYYLADLVLALCEGPIEGIGQVWKGQSTSLFAVGSPNPNGWALPVNAYGLSFLSGEETQAAWAGVSGTPWELNYSGTAYVAAKGFNLGESASIGTLNFEVAGRFYGTGANGVDADPALVIEDFLTNPRYGAGYAGALANLSGASGDGSLQTYCRALGLCFSPQIAQFEAANSILARWMQALNVGAVKSGAVLKFIPYGDLPITGNGVSFVPNVAPVYDLTDDDFLFDEGEEPVKVSRVDPRTLPTVQRVDVLNRAGVNVAQALVVQQINEVAAAMQSASSAGRSSGSFELPSPNGLPQYQSTPVEARDQSAIQTVGLRVGDTATLHEICDLNVGATIAQIMLQRGLYVRATFSFRLPSALFCLLDPMDIVTIPDRISGKKAVRITAIQETDAAVLEVSAEEFVLGVATPGPNITMGAVSGSNTGLPAPAVNAVLIWEPPASLTNGVAQIWFGASGGAAGVLDPNWGGCHVWASIDGGVTYAQIAKIVAPIAQGPLTAAAASASGWDTSSTLSVDLGESGQQLLTTTEQNARAGAANLSLVGSELIAFETATLTAVNRYDLTNLQRGLFGTTPAAHSSGDQFSQLDNVAKIDLDPSYVGKPLKIKFVSFNRYGQGEQSIADCTPFDYTPAGAGYQNSTRLATKTETISLSAGSSVSTTIAIPASAWLLSVSVVIVADVSGPSSIKIDPVIEANGAAGGSSGEFGSVGVLAGNSHTYSTAATLWSAASAIRLTANGAAFAGGSATVAIEYITVG